MPEYWITLLNANSILHDKNMKRWKYYLYFFQLVTQGENLPEEKKTKNIVLNIHFFSCVY